MFNICYLLFAVSEHYNGNRYRNQLVREDFPTAVSEQMKERQNAERQAALYHEMINQQEEADCMVAQQLAEQLRRDGERRRLAMIAQDESLGHHLQHSMHIGDPIAVRNELPPVPPKNFPQKLSTSNHLLQHSPTNSLDHSPTSPKPQSNRPSPLHYVTIDLPSNGPPSTTRNPIPMNIPAHSRTHYSQVMPQQPTSAVVMNSPVKSHYDHLELQSHTPEKPRHPHERDLNLNHSGAGGAKSLAFPQSPVDFGAAADEIRTIGENEQFPFNLNQNSRSHRQRGSIEHNLDEIAGRSNEFVHKLSLEKYDMIMGNISPTAEEPLNGGAASFEEANGNSGMSGRDLDRIRTMQECGVPAEEMMEINRRITQQERDEVSAGRKLLFILDYLFRTSFKIFINCYFCRSSLANYSFKKTRTLRLRNKTDWWPWKPRTKSLLACCRKG